MEEANRYAEAMAEGDDEDDEDEDDVDLDIPGSSGGFRCLTGGDPNCSRKRRHSSEEPKININLRNSNSVITNFKKQRGRRYFRAFPLIFALKTSYFFFLFSDSATSVSSQPPSSPVDAKSILEEVQNKLSKVGTNIVIKAETLTPSKTDKPLVSKNTNGCLIDTDSKPSGITVIHNGHTRNITAGTELTEDMTRDMTRKAKEGESGDVQNSKPIVKDIQTDEKENCGAAKVINGEKDEKVVVNGEKLTNGEEKKRCDIMSEWDLTATESPKLLNGRQDSDNELELKKETVTRTYGRESNGLPKPVNGAATRGPLTNGATPGENNRFTFNADIICKHGKNFLRAH